MGVFLGPSQLCLLPLTFSLLPPPPRVLPGPHRWTPVRDGICLPCFPGLLRLSLTKEDPVAGGGPASDFSARGPAEHAQLQVVTRSPTSRELQVCNDLFHCGKGSSAFQELTFPSHPASSSSASTHRCKASTASQPSQRSKPTLLCFVKL